MDTKYFVFDNATRRFKVGGFSFVFDVVEQFGGGWRGVMILNDQAQYDALQTFAASVGILEITKDEYDAFLKKKTPSMESSEPSILPNLPPIHRDVEVVVRNKNTGPSTAKKVTAEIKPIGLDEAVLLGEAPYIDPLDEKSSKRKVKNAA